MIKVLAETVYFGVNDSPIADKIDLEISNNYC